ncbi:MAG: HD domain-containing protein [Clostridia bacterium]|nr:HD domain-containing protein [Clostridia bacterium]
MTSSNTEIAILIAKRVAAEGGRAYFVGGFVRDRLLGTENKDIDVEVHGISPASLEKILDSVGERISMGESFGIYGLKGADVDVAMPRKEKVRGKGHRDFEVFVDPFIGTEKASARRDFTVNAMMQDVLTGEIIDHHGGREDLCRGVLRHVSDESFGEDPLRVLRLCQFAARFGFSAHPSTVEICKKMDVSTLSRERVDGELKKALLKSERPSVFFELLRETEQLAPWFAELLPLIGLRQDPKYHAEGDVWTHTMLVLDEAAKLRHKAEDPYGFMLAALTHDMGKALCTEKVGDRIHSYGHEVKGLPVIRQFLSRLTAEKRLIRYVLSLAEYHMKPNTLAGAGSSVKSTNKMFDAVADPEALICLALADSRGREKAGDNGDNSEFLYGRLEIYREYMSRPYVTGKDLFEAGLHTGEQFSELLSFAHKLRLAGVDKESALKQTIAMAKDNKR